MDKYLVLKGCAGIGNRLFCVADALDYCIKTNRILFVDWSDGQFSEKYTNIFNSFFYIDHNLYRSGKIEDYVLADDCYPKTWNNKIEYTLYDMFDYGTPKKYLRNLYFFKKKYSQLWIKNNLIEKYGKEEIYFNKSMDKGQNVSNRIVNYGFLSFLDRSNMSFGNNLALNIDSKVIVYADFFPELSNFSVLKFIKLQPEIKLRLTTFIENYNIDKDCIGLHIRNTDKKPKTSITDLIKYLKLNFSKKRIFLSTDDLKIENLFKREFKNLITYNKKLSENRSGVGLHYMGINKNDESFKKQVLVDSVMDIWILSKCEKLLFQGNSSFSIFSSLIHKKSDNCYDWLKLS